MWVNVLYSAHEQIIPFSRFYEIGFGEVSGIVSTKSNIMIHLL